MNIRKILTIVSAVIAGGVGVALANAPQAAHAGVTMN
jgi:hypothetical protein